MKKETYENGMLMATTYYVRDVAGSVMAIYGDAGGEMALAEQPIYGAGRIGVAYTAHNSVTYVYELTDHLGNVRAVFTKNNSDATLEGYTDYFSGGMAMPNRNMTGAEQYRYGYQGQYAETDPETGKPAFQLRLYDPRIMRWLTTDPARQHHSPYLAMGNNPIRFIDPDGGVCKDLDGNAIPCGDNDITGQYSSEISAEDLYVLDEVVVTLLDSRLNEHSNNLGALAKGHKYSGLLYNNLAGQVDKLKPLAQIGRFDPKFQTDFLNKNISAQMGNVYSKDALRSISNLKTGLKVLGRTAPIAGYYSSYDAFSQGDNFRGYGEAGANTTGIGIGYALGIGPGLGWSIGWESGKVFWATDVGQKIRGEYMSFMIPDSRLPRQYRSDYESILLRD